MIILKFLLVYILILPATLLTSIIWIFGGWIKGWDYMPNPVYKLISLIDDDN